MLFSMFTYCSCSEYAYLENDYYHVNEAVTIDIVIARGIPHYYDGYLSYYYYRNMYYYPLYYDGYWWWRAYRYPFVEGYMPRWTPNPRDMHFKPGYHGFGIPNHKFRGTPSRTSIEGVRRSQQRPMNRNERVVVPPRRNPQVDRRRTRIDNIEHRHTQTRMPMQQRSNNRSYTPQQRNNIQNMQRRPSNRRNN